jgi:hypothetical protein
VLPVCHIDRLLELAADADRQLNSYKLRESGLGLTVQEPDTHVDIHLLRLDAIAKGADLVAMYAAGAVDCALDGDEAMLECALRCMVASVNATLHRWRELRLVVPESEGGA